VKYTTSLREDLARRDFTVNAMAYHPREGLSDPFGGADDIKNRVIRAVGSPVDRLREDALRILRGIRFAGGLEFCLDESLARAIEENAGLLRMISPERIAAELSAILTLSSPKKALELMGRLGIWAYILPELADTRGFEQHSEHHNLCVYGHTISAVENLPPVLPLRMAALLHDIAKPEVFTVDAKGKGHFYHHETVGAKMAAAIMNRLRYSHDLRAKVVMLIQHHMQHIKDLSDADLRSLVSGLPKPREENIELILSLQKADLLASVYDEDSLVDFEIFASQMRATLTCGCPLDLADLAVAGCELEGLGVAPEDRGRALKAMLEEVLLDPSENTRETLLWIASFFASG
jgi:tRNA nucleotidyltransferase (CCA-adding enzyme)